MTGALLAAVFSAGSAFGQTPLKIGVIAGFSGIYGDLTAGQFEAAQMAAEEVGGKVLGRPIEIVQADHQNKPDVGATIVRKWYDNDGVSMVTGIDTSSVGLAVRQVANEKGRSISTSARRRRTSPVRPARRPARSWIYDTYALAPVTGSALVQSGRRLLVLHHRRLCLRPRAGARHDGGREGDAGGKVAGRHQAPALLAGLLVLPAAGAGLKAKIIGARQCRRRHRQHHQASRRVRHHQGRPEAGRSAVLRPPTCRRSA